jgi:hypothetical protein
MDEEMEKPKDSFSIKPIDVDSAYMLANTMMADVANLFPKLALTKSNSGTAPTAPTVPKEAVQASPPVPLNAANLHQQQQALKQQQAKVHNRQGSRSGPPAAPTSSQPPFPIGSPHPDQFPKTSLTQEQLRLPLNKKQRLSNNTTPVVGQQASASATPIMKSGSPGFPNQTAQPRQAEKVALQCMEPDCERHWGEGFENAEALKKHTDEEHINPLKKPQEFAEKQLAIMLGLEADGTAKRNPATESTGDSNQITSTLQQVQATTAKAEGTPAASATPLNRQASTAGVKSSTVSKAGKQEATNGQHLNNTKSSSEFKPRTDYENLWDSASVNPQDLQTNFKQLETGASGAISDMSVWRAITPNDTPESSKDGVSEPNSDITDGVDLTVNLDIDFNFDVGDNWQPFGPSGDEFLDFGKLDVNTDLTNNDLSDILMADEKNNPTNFSSFNEFVDFDKPFSWDTSLLDMTVD